MRTQIEIASIAIGIVAILGATFAAPGPASAAPGIDRDRGYQRGIARQYDGAAVRGARTAKPAAIQRPAKGSRKAVPARPIVKVGNGPRRPPAQAYYGPTPKRIIVVPERRRYRNVWVVRPHGHRYHGYGRYRHDRDAYNWLAFTAISVGLVNAMTEHQQRAYEDAQVRAASAPVGETIHWNDNGASGTVTATREGNSSLDRYCREFQQTVTIGGKTEEAYGTACRQPDGAWEVIP